MKALKYLLIASAALIVTACSFDKNSNPEDRVTEENNAYLREKFSAVGGVYFGNLTTTDGSVQDVRLTMTIVQIPVGKDSRGQDKLGPALSGRFSFESTAKSDVILNKVDYIDSNIPPQLLMTSTADGGVNPDNITSRFDVLGETLQGEINIAGRRLGTATLKLVTRDTSGPGAGDQNAENDRLIRLYQPLSGDYYGQVTVPRSVGKTFGVSVSLSVGWKADPRDATGIRQIPALIGVFKRDLNPDQNNTILKVEYISESNPPILTMIADSSSSGGEKYERVNIRGTIQNGVLDGNFQGNDRRSFPITLKKQ